MTHFFTHTFWGGFIVGVAGNLVASGVLVIPTILKQARKTRLHNTRLHEETRQHHAEHVDRLIKEVHRAGK